jgi:hypothetical protein
MPQAKRPRKESLNVQFALAAAFEARDALRENLWLKDVRTNLPEPEAAYREMIDSCSKPDHAGLFGKLGEWRGTPR